jgi:hypothetical protein
MSGASQAMHKDIYLLLSFLVVGEPDEALANASGDHAHSFITTAPSFLSK